MHLRRITLLALLVALAAPGMARAQGRPVALNVAAEGDPILDRAGPEWDAVRAARHLAVSAPSDFPNTEMDLVILLPQDG